VEQRAASDDDLDRRIDTVKRVADLDRMVVASGNPVPMIDRVFGDVPLDRAEDRLRLATLLQLHLSSPNRVAVNADVARSLVSTSFTDDPELELQVLVVRHRMLTSSPELGPRLAITERVRLLADALGSDRARLTGLLLGIINDVRRGEHEAARSSLAQLRGVGGRSYEPVWTWHAHLITACLDELHKPGSGDEAARAAHATARRYGIPDGPEALAVWTYLRAYTTGELAALASAIEAQAVRSGNPAWHAGAALALVRDDPRRAAQLVSRAWAGRASVEATGIWLVHCCICLEAAVRVGDAAVAAEASEVLRPFSGQWVVMGSASSCFGPVDRFLSFGVTSRRERTRLRDAARAEVDRVGSTTWQGVLERE
jgi:hypothetical protein